jgi:hypothetical protein
MKIKLKKNRLYSTYIYYHIIPNFNFPKYIKSAQFYCTTVTEWSFFDSNLISKNKFLVIKRLRGYLS